MDFYLWSEKFYQVSKNHPKGSDSHLLHFVVRLHHPVSEGLEHSESVVGLPGRIDDTLDIGALTGEHIFNRTIGFLLGAIDFVQVTGQHLLEAGSV